MALTAGRMTKRRDGKQFQDPVAASTTIYTGALVCLDASGNAVPGATATTLTARGICDEGVTNAGSAGDVVVNVTTGCFLFKNSSSTDAITRAEIGDNCYIVDDETVAKTSGSSTRSIAGKIVDVDSNGVWVQIG